MKVSCTETKKIESYYCNLELFILFVVVLIYVKVDICVQNEIIW